MVHQVAHGLLLGRRKPGDFVAVFGGGFAQLRWQRLVLHGPRMASLLLPLRHIPQGLNQPAGRLLVAVFIDAQRLGRHAGALRHLFPG